MSFFVPGLFHLAEFSRFIHVHVSKVCFFMQLSSIPCMDRAQFRITRGALQMLMPRPHPRTIALDPPGIRTLSGSPGELSVLPVWLSCSAGSGSQGGNGRESGGSPGVQSSPGPCGALTALGRPGDCAAGWSRWRMALTQH